MSVEHSYREQPKAKTPIYNALVKTLPSFWDPDDFVVCGSAALAVRGIRDVNDLDVLIRPDLWEATDKKGWSWRRIVNLIGGLLPEEHYGNSWETKQFRQYTIDTDHLLAPARGRKIDVFDRMPLLAEEDTQAVFEDAVIHDGIKVVSLRHCLAVKALANRKKDYTDMIVLAQLIRDEESVYDGE